MERLHIEGEIPPLPSSEVRGFLLVASFKKVSYIFRVRGRKEKGDKSSVQHSLLSVFLVDKLINPIDKNKSAFNC